jgi:hypothetical protein
MRRVWAHTGPGPHPRRAGRPPIGHTHNAPGQGPLSAVIAIMFCDPNLDALRGTVCLYV